MKATASPPGGKSNLRLAVTAASPGDRGVGHAGGPLCDPREPVPWRRVLTKSFGSHGTWSPWQTGSGDRFVFHPLKSASSCESMVSNKNDS